MTNETPDQAAFNPYQAPGAVVVDADAQAEAPAFFPVTRFKLIVMSLASAGFYEIYWFYKNWRCVQSREKIDVPVRTVFYPLVAYSLFAKVQKMANEVQAVAVPGPGILAFLVFVLAVCGGLPDPYWVVGLGSFLPLLPVQTTIIEINRRIAPKADPNGNFSWANFVWMAIGAVVYLLLFIEIVPKK